MSGIHMVVAALMYLQTAVDLEQEFFVPVNEVQPFSHPLVLKIKKNNYVTEMLPIRDKIHCKVSRSLMSWGKNQSSQETLRF